MTAYHAVHTSPPRSTGAPARVPGVGEAEHSSNLLRGIGFGLAFVAPFWIMVALVLLRIL